MYSRYLAVVASVFVLVGGASAAPPAATHLSPAGGQRGTDVLVTALGSFDPWPVQVWTSHPGLKVEPQKDKGKIKVTIAKDTPPGTHYVRFHNPSGASPLRPFIVGNLPETEEKESNDSPQQAQAVPANTVVNGRLGRSGDVDAFAVTLDKGQTLVASITANKGLPSPMDAVIQVLSPDGFVIDQNNDYNGFDPQVTITATQPGPHVVRVFAFPAAPDSSIRYSGADTYIYRLTLSTRGLLESTVTTAIQQGQSAPLLGVGSGLPEKGIRLELPKGKLGSQVTLSHSSIPGIAEVAVEPHPVIDGTAKRDQAALAAPFSYAGWLKTAKQEDQIRIVGKKGQALLVRVESAARGFAASPAIRIHDAANKQVGRMDPPAIARDCEIAFTPPADGEYTITIMDLHGDHGPLHRYLLRVTPQTPNFTLTIATDRISMNPGKSIDVAITVNRINRFSQPITITALGLPDGVTLKTKSSDQKAITLELQASDKPWSGPIQLVGKSGDQLEHMVTASIPDTTGTSTELWLTIAADAKPPEPMKKRRR